MVFSKDKRVGYKTNFKFHFCCNKFAVTQRADPHATAAPPFSRLYPAIFSSAVSISRFGPFWFSRKLCFAHTSILHIFQWCICKGPSRAETFSCEWVSDFSFLKRPKLKRWQTRMCASSYPASEWGRRRRVAITHSTIYSNALYNELLYHAWPWVFNVTTNTHLMSCVTDYCYTVIFRVIP